MTLSFPLHGFALRESRALPELDATLWELRHEATGAKLVWLDRSEENKTFAIAFQTQPWDDTGVFHILEHSVLCGSERYPVKEPFVELLKSSLNTFLNALTYPDKTVYPVSSRNERDFMNLMGVYLDAVFFPRIHQKPEIFAQEGWHYELTPEGRAGYKGVVFNEMRGAFADPDELTERAVMAALFPETCYRFVSGGDPEAIPTLTYEDFTAAHKRLYHPSNAYIFLDGNLDLDKVLGVLDGEYLSRFRAIAPPPAIPVQPPVDGGTTRVEYELGESEDPSRRTRLTWGRVAGTFDEREKLVGLDVLTRVLCGDNQAPLTRAVLSQGLAEGVTMDLQDQILQPYLVLEVKNLREEDADKVNEVLTGELERLCREGLPRPRLEAALANLEFKMRERDTGADPQGVVLAVDALASWLYGGDPAQELVVGDLFDRLRARVEDGWFEDLIREVILDDPHRCQVVLVPSKTAGEARRAREAARLRAAEESWSEADREEIARRQRELETWQESEDSPEALATLPTLALSDVSPEPETVPTQELTADGTAVFHHPIPTAGIVYLRACFDADDCAPEDLAALGFLRTLLGKLSTRDHTARELADLSRLLCGSMGFLALPYPKRGPRGGCGVKFVAELSALEKNLPAAVDLMAEILTATRWEEDAAAHELLRQKKQGLQEAMVTEGEAVALSRLDAQFTAAGVAGEWTSGYEHYRWLTRQETDWNWPRLSGDLARLLSRLACAARLTVSVTGGTEDLARSAAERMRAALPMGEAARAGTLEPWGVRREGVVIPADVSFAVRGGDLMRAGADYSGGVILGKQVVSLCYLWNVVRVQGGAYGTGLVARPNGLACCYSYRDPDGKASLEKYLGCGAFLRELAQSGGDLTGFIIGAVAGTEPLVSPRLRGVMADNDRWRGITYQDRRTWRRQLLEAAPQDLIALAAALETALEQGGVCVVGPQSQLDQCALDRVFTL